MDQEFMHWSKTNNTVLLRRLLQSFWILFKVIAILVPQEKLLINKYKFKVVRLAKSII